MEDLKHLCNSRKGYRVHLKKLLAKANDLIERHRHKDPDLEVVSLTDLRDQIQRKDNLISDLDDKIQKLITNDEELVQDVCEAEEIKESLSTAIAHVTRILETITTRTADSVTQPRPDSDRDTQPLESARTETTTQGTHTDTSSTIRGALHTTPTDHHTARLNAVPETRNITRLPKLSIPVFSGDTLQWQSFWDCFEAAIHYNPSITGVQKLNYLRAQLQGNALRVISGLPLTNANYDHSVTLLKARYGEPHKLIDAHMQALIELSNPSNTLPALQLFYDSIEGHIRSLQSLGTSQEQYGSMLVPIILRKLSAETRRNLARSHGSDQWTLNELLDTILQELRILETGHTTLHTPTATFFTNTDRRQRSCTFCKSTSHTTSKCNVITDKQKRVEVVKQENLCFNCLGHHKISQCPSKYRCKICKRKHHTSLCDDKNNLKPGTNTEQDNNGTTEMEKNIADPNSAIRQSHPQSDVA